MKRFLTFCLLGVILLGGYGGYRWLFPSDEKRIVHILRTAAEAASIRPHAGALEKMGAVNRLVDLCTQDVEITLGGPGLGHRTIQGQDPMRELALASKASSQAVSIQLRDIGVTITEDRSQATAQFILQARLEDGSDDIFQEFQIELVRADSQWRIRRVQPMPSLGL